MTDSTVPVSDFEGKERRALIRAFLFPPAEGIEREEQRSQERMIAVVAALARKREELIFKVVSGQRDTSL